MSRSHKKRRDLYNMFKTTPHKERLTALCGVVLIGIILIKCNDRRTGFVCLPHFIGNDLF